MHSPYLRHLRERAERRRYSIKPAVFQEYMLCKQPVYSRYSRSSCLVLNFADATAIPCTIGAHTLVVHLSIELIHETILYYVIHL